MLPINVLQDTVLSSKQEASAQFSALQARGEEIESQLRHVLTRTNLQSTTQWLRPAAKRCTNRSSHQKWSLVELVATPQLKKRQKRKLLRRLNRKPRLKLNCYAAAPRKRATTTKRTTTTRQKLRRLKQSLKTLNP